MNLKELKIYLERKEKFNDSILDQILPKSHNTNKVNFKEFQKKNELIEINQRKGFYTANIKYLNLQKETINKKLNNICVDKVKETNTYKKEDLLFDKRKPLKILETNIKVNDSLLIPLNDSLNIREKIIKKENFNKQFQISNSINKENKNNEFNILQKKLLKAKEAKIKELVLTEKLLKNKLKANNY